MKPKKFANIASFPCRRSALLLVGSLTALLATHSAHAATKTWTGATSSTWNTSAANWSPSLWVAADDAVFGTTGAGAITVSGTQSVGALTVSSAGYSFTGGTLSLSNATTTNNTWSFSNDTTIASAVSLTSTTSGLLNKTGAGKLLLSGAVTITGTVANPSFFTSTAGTLEFSGGLTATNTGIFAAPGNVLISGGTNLLSGTSTRRGIVVGGNGGTFTVSGGTTTAAGLNAANGSTGTYSQTNGSVTLKSDANASVAVNLGAGAGSSTTSTINLDGGTLTALGMAPSTGWLGTSTINLNGGTFISGAANTNLLNTNVTGSGLGSIFVKSGGALIDTNSFAATQVQPLLAGSPSGGLTKSGTGTLTLSGANTYTGATKVTAGILSLGNVLALQNSPLDTFNSIPGNTTNGLKTTVTTLTLGGLTGNKDLASVFTTVSGGYSGVTALTLNPGTGATPSYSGAIANGASAMNLTKTGAGTQTLSGTNTYTGATLVSAGTLLVNGSLANTTTTVSGTGTLKGSGSIGGSVTIGSGGTLATGNSIESLATGALSFTTGSNFQYELDSDVAQQGDLTAVTGNLSLAGTVNLSFLQTGSSSWLLGSPLGDHLLGGADKLTLISYTGAWNGGLFRYAGFDVLDDSAIVINGQQWWFNYNDTDAGTNFVGDLTGANFVTMTVPEPNAATLLGGLGVLALVRRRRN